MLLQVFGIPCPQWLLWEVRYVCLSVFLSPTSQCLCQLQFFSFILGTLSDIHLPSIRGVDDVAAFFQRSWEEGYLKRISFELLGLVLPLDFPFVLSCEI